MVDDLRAVTDVAPVELSSVVEQYDDQPDECTIFQSDLPESRRLCTWISAKDGSYVDLATCR